MSDLVAAALASNAWPFQEAKALLEKRLAKRGKGNEGGEKGYVLFETGYGPSGLPHIGTFGEVVRTTMVRNALHIIAPGVKTRLFAFSDDMDGLRKVPDNIPDKEMVRAHLGKPLTRIPDPFGTHESFGHHNNARLCAFLDSFGFEYEFQSSTEWYASGRFDATLLAVLARHDEVKAVVLPTLGEERRATYSPFLPICPETGVVLQAPVVETDAKAGTIVYKRDDGKLVETPVTGGAVKLQWKADWAMRWAALGVDYEMSGKDLIDSVKLASRIVRILGGEQPQNLTYELFLDDKGEKISKSRGNGLAVEEWLKYAPPESLSLFMYQKPKAAKRLYFDVIPRAVDEYQSFVSAFPRQSEAERLANPAWHIHNGRPPAEAEGVAFSMLLNLVSVCHSDDPAVIWQYLSRYVPGADAKAMPFLDSLVRCAIAYYRDFVLPKKAFRKPNAEETAALKHLREEIAKQPANATPEDLQTVVYEVGKTHACFADLKAWFQALYQMLLGQDTGPRMGSFFALYGLAESIALLDKAIAGEELG
ncbi:lysine--tRNA ligase [Oleispirillum naphthae]|uniref:lysine--tRNA ligase n=1 Tax=Oleispirillum naphthae TaxID=2838853 RepID=UPI00308263A4